MLVRKLTLALACLIQCLALLFPPAGLWLGTEKARAADAEPQVIINELHYDPRDRSAGAEYVELYNRGAAAVDLTGWSLAKGVEYQFGPGAYLPAGGYLLVARNPQAVKYLYGSAALGPFLGKLANEGEELLLRDRNGRAIDDLTYGIGFPWPTPDDDADQSLGLSNPQLDNSVPGAWRSGAPTPGWGNSGLTDNPPPFVDRVEHLPAAPRSTDAVTVRAHVTDADGVGSVRLWLQVVAPGYYIRITDPEYQAEWVSVPMANAGEDVYVAQVPEHMRRHRMLVRYRVEAFDSGGRSVMTPYADDPQPNFALFVYDDVPAWTAAINPQKPGTTRGIYNTYNFGAMRPLPLYHLLARTEDIADAQYIPPSALPAPYTGDDYLWKGTLVVNGVVYDHIGFRARGGEFRHAVGKNNWKFDLTRGHGLQAYDDYGKPYASKWDKLDFSSVMQHANRKYRGEQGMFESLSYRMFNLAGVPASRTHFVHFRVVDQWEQTTGSQYTGDFWGLYLAIENMDGQFLDSHELPDGNLYDMFDWSGELDNQGDGAVGDKSDLNAFMQTYTTSWPDPTWWRNHFDLDGYFKFRSVLEAIHHYDVDQGKNYYYYLNPYTTKWSILPWDLDLTWTETMFGEGAEPFRDRVLPHAEFNIAYQNQLRELRDLLFNPDQMFPLIDETAALIDTPGDGLSMVDADRALWDYNPILISPHVNKNRAIQGRYYNVSPSGDFNGMVRLLKEYVQRRTGWIDQTLLAEQAQPRTPSLAYVGPAGFPADQLQVRTSGFEDPQGGDSFAALQWRAAEISRPGLPGYTENSRWRYEIQATWVSQPLTSFNADMTVPRGACRPGVLCRVRVRMQDSSGRWSHWSAPLEIVAGAPVLGPSPDLRISEIMYRPAPSLTAPSPDLEFLELTNSGEQPIDLSNMRFADGIEYRFPPGVRLWPNQHLVLANQAEAFAAFYGVRPFGQYSKDLSNGGERLLLLDAFDVPALDVTYSDEDGWPEAADGGGASLVALPGDPNSAASWRASTVAGGSPGVADPLPVVINEVQIDPADGSVRKVELYNPSAQEAGLGGWLLTAAAIRRDAGANEIPPGSWLPQDFVLAPGGYGVVDLPQGSVVLDGGISTLTILSAVQGSRLTGYEQHAHLPLSPRAGDLTAGRITTSDRLQYYTVLRSPTWGSPNAEAQPSPLVVSAFSASPADGVQWVELTNTTAQMMRLYNPKDLGRSWLVASIPYPLPAGVELQPGGRVIITSGEPADVCRSGQVPAGLRVIGPLARGLNANGFDLALLQPFAWGEGWSYGTVDRVHYRNEVPWPRRAPNVVMTRIALDGFGSEPTNWQGRSIGGASSLDGLQGGVLAPNAAADLCSFDVVVNGSGKLEVRWVAKPLGKTVGFRLLRSPLDDPDAKVVVATRPAVAAPDSGVPDLVQLVDGEADPQGRYIYWLQSVEEGDKTRDVALTTIRAQVGMSYLPIINP
jgi:hypothetical protein